MKKILVMFTGGTIGSSKNNQIINVDEDSMSLLLAPYHKNNIRKDLVFDTLQPTNMLSENLVPEDWMIFFDTISQVYFDKYEGIIITHGSDTLPYTSAALSYILNYTKIPIVLVASNYPLEDEKSNGLRNFTNAVDFILEMHLPGIFVIFENNEGESIVHLGTRLTEAAHFTDEFKSVNAVSFGKMLNGHFVRNEQKFNPKLEDFDIVRKSLKTESFSFSSEILFIYPHPGLNYSKYDFSNIKPKAVLHDLYHSGTACMRTLQNRNYSLVEFTKYCRECGVDVYIAPLKNLSEGLYYSSSKIIEQGAVPLQNIAVEAAIVKLMLAYGSFEDRDIIKRFLMNEMLFFEFIKEGDTIEKPSTI